jgi:branched-chain amino acid transport system substrate-binding protein
LAQAYAVGVVIQRCVEECGYLEDGVLREAAASLDFTTFYGRFRIDSETGRQVGKRSLLVQWRQGRKVIVWPPEYRQETLAYPWR